MYASIRGTIVWKSFGRRLADRPWLNRTSLHLQYAESSQHEGTSCTARCSETFPHDSTYKYGHGYKPVSFTALFPSRVCKICFRNSQRKRAKRSNISSVLPTRRMVYFYCWFVKGGHDEGMSGTSVVAPLRGAPLNINLNNLVSFSNLILLS